MAVKTWLGNDSGNEGDVNTAANWSPSGVPTASDELYFDGAVSNQNVTAGLATLAAVSLTSIIIKHSFTGTVGTQGSPLQVDAATTVRIGVSTGESSDEGSQRINLELGNGAASNVVVERTASNSADTGLPPVRVTSDHASSTLSVLSGRVGTGVDETQQASNWNKIACSGGQLIVGDNVTIGTHAAVSDGGILINFGSANPLAIAEDGGSYEAQGSGAHTKIEVQGGGSVTYNSSGTLTTLECAGEFDGSGDPRAKTLTTVKLFAGATFDMDNGVPGSTTFTNGIELVQASPQSVSISLPSDVTLTPSW